MNRFIRICKYFVDRYESKFKAKQELESKKLKEQAVKDFKCFMDQKGDKFKEDIQDASKIETPYQLGKNSFKPCNIVIEVDLTKKRT